MTEPSAAMIAYVAEAKEWDARPDACIRDFVDGPLCAQGCGVPTHRFSQKYPHMQGPPYHQCPKPHQPDDFIRIVLDEQHEALVQRFGAETVRQMREWMEYQTWWGDMPRPYLWAHKK